MQSQEFWRDLQAQFRKLDDPYRDLHAQDCPDGTWAVFGGPDHDVRRRSLQDQFRTLSTRAAVAADLPLKNGSAVDAWLDHLRKGAHFQPVKLATVPVVEGTVSLEGGWIDSLCIASAECCVELETAAFEARWAGSVTPDTMSAYRADANGKSEKVGDRIDRLRQECGLSVEELAEQVRLDRSSVLDHTANRAKPRLKSLREYQTVFSKGLGREVTIKELRDDG